MSKIQMKKKFKYIYYHPLFCSQLYHKGLITTRGRHLRAKIPECYSRTLAFEVIGKSRIIYWFSIFLENSDFLISTDLKSEFFQKISECQFELILSRASWDHPELKEPWFWDSFLWPFSPFCITSHFKSPFPHIFKPKKKLSNRLMSSIILYNKIKQKR